MLIDPPLPLLLGVTGGLLQYAVRQFDRAPEWLYHGLAVALCFGLYVLVNPSWNQGEWREVTINAVAWLAERVPTVWGGTFITAVSAKALASKVGSESMAVPVSNSK